MFSLPPARREWKCGSEWVNGEETINPDNGCGQRIYQSNKEKYRSGKYKVLNAENGEGGKRDDPHVCPKRLGSRFDHTNREVNWNEYHWHQMNHMCSICAQIFDTYRNPLCPTCFRRVCRDCGNIQTWIILIEGVCEKCFQCGSEKLDVIQVMRAYERLYGKWEF